MSMKIFMIIEPDHVCHVLGACASEAQLRGETWVGGPCLREHLGLILMRMIVIIVKIAFSPLS